MMNSSELVCEVCVVHFCDLKVKEGGFGLKFVKVVSDLMDVIN